MTCTTLLILSLLLNFIYLRVLHKNTTINCGAMVVFNQILNLIDLDLITGSSRVCVEFGFKPLETIREI